MLTTVERLKKRAQICQQIRAFFDDLGYLEVDTPLLGTATNTDRHIQSIEARVNQRTHYLQTSPEFSMKRLLADGSGSIYQICHAFRNEEQGRIHLAEFSLLEWYSTGFNYQALMQQMESLICLLSGHRLSIPQIGYYQAFQRYLNLSLDVASVEDLQRCVGEYIPGISSDHLTFDDCLDLLISQVICKQFDGFVFVYDYPASQASLARIKEDNSQLAERFELFFNDLELANGFTELTDHLEQRHRFEQDNQQRLLMGLQPYPIDESFLSALEQGLPECAGVAMGLDRLLMVLNNLEDIHQIQPLNTLEPL